MHNAYLSSGELLVGVNPKVNNLMLPFAQAEHDLLWVVDAGVKVLPGTLARSVDALINPLPADVKSGRKLGLVHHVPFVISSTNSVHLGSRLEEAFLNTTHAKMYLALNALAIDSCVVGKSNLYRRSDVRQLTGTLSTGANILISEASSGLANFGKYLPEDNMIAASIWHELGMRHTLSCDVAYNVLGDMTLRDYMQRRIRWIRVRKHMVLAATLLEPLTESALLIGLSSWTFRHSFSIPPWMFVPVSLSIWFYIDLDVYSSLANHPLPNSKRLPFFCAWFLRELLAFPIWLVALFGNTVEWRGVKYRVLRNGEAEKLTSFSGRRDIDLSKQSTQSFEEA